MTGAGCGAPADPLREGPGPVIRAIGRAMNGVVVHAPWLWPFLRRAMTRFFDAAAVGWDERIRARSPEHLEQHLAPLVAAAGLLSRPPSRVLEVGTGTGVGALWLAQRFPEADVLGIDISAKMIQEAEAKAGSPELGRVRFVVADIAALKNDQSFDLVAMLNMPPFFEPVVSLIAPQGYVAWGASLGPKTPYFTPLDTLKRGFERRGVRTVEAGVAGAGVFYLGRRASTTERPGPDPDVG